MKISIITATRNRASVLGTALDSLASQTFSDWEHLVQDGGDDTATTALLEIRPDPRRSIVRAPDQGLYDALNRAILRASGDIVGVLHSDDIFAGPDVLGSLANAFADPSITAVYGDLEYVSSKKPQQVLRHWKAGSFSPEKLQRGWAPPHPTLFLRRSVLGGAEPYDKGLDVSADYDLMLRLFRQPDFSAAYIPEVLVQMRSGGLSNGSICKIARRSYQDLQVLKKKRHGRARGVGVEGTTQAAPIRNVRAGPSNDQTRTGYRYYRAGWLVSG